jgi:transcriptional regulator with XRE-family HTH domain
VTESESVKAPSPVDKHVGGRVRLRRREIGMTQEELAERLGITYQQIQKYEKGTNRIGASRLHQVAGVLGVPVPWFFFGMAKQLGESEPDPFPEATEAGDEITRWLATDEARELILAVTHIPDGAVKRAFCELVLETSRAARDRKAVRAQLRRN